MKKTILILGAALLLAGCEKQQGGTTDQYGTDRGTTSGSTPSSRERNSSLMTNNAPSSTFTNQSTLSTTNEPGATSATNTTKPSNP